MKKVYKNTDFPKPRNALGFVKGIPDAEMEKLILANTAADEGDMQQLAQLRAKQVVDNLIQIQVLASLSPVEPRRTAILVPALMSLSVLIGLSRFTNTTLPVNI